MKEIRGYKINGIIYEDKTHAEYEQSIIDLRDIFDEYFVHSNLDFESFIELLEEEMWVIKEFLNKRRAYERKFLV